MTHTKPTRFRVEDLIRYAAALFGAAGCDGDKPDTIAAGLVEADLFGHTTHGLQLAPAYLAYGARAVSLARHYREFEGLSTSQIADHLGRSPATIKAC